MQFTPGSSAAGVQDSVSVQNKMTDAVVAEPLLGEVAAALRGLRFGQITIVVQDGVVVQIDRIERRRITRRR